MMPVDNMMKTEINNFLDSLKLSPKTIFAYRNALQQFLNTVGEDAVLNTAAYIQFLISLENKSASTQRLYTTAVLKFYTFCMAGNVSELKNATQHYRRKSGKRIVKFNSEAVERVIAYCESLNGETSTSLSTKLEVLRDRAFVLTLADTGLRISEACSLKRGDIDLDKRRGIIGKSDNQDMIRFSKRSIRALIEYLHVRSSVEPNSRQTPASQPLFARHDIRASKKIRPITPGGMWKAIKDRIAEAGVDRRMVRIHDFRHYFVTTIYLTKKDLKLSQELARHKSISTTYRYAHLGSEADMAYDDIFNEK
jgi:integrase/recombinase XerC